MNKKQKSIKLNFIMNILLTMSSLIFPLITFPYISRILLPSGTGKISFATSLISYFSMFAQLGVPMYGIRACAKVRDDKIELSKTVHELFFINLMTSILSYIALIFLLITVPKLKEERTLYILVSSSIFLTTIGIEWLYRALEQYTYITIRSLILKIISILAMFMLIHKEGDYILYSGISVCASSASNIFNFINARKYINLKWIGNYNIKKHLKPVLIFFAMACATTIYTNLDTVMLGFATNDIEVGYYNAAIKIKNILKSIVTALGAVLLPRASYYIENGLINEFKQISQKALNFVFLLATPLMIYFIFFAKEGIIFLSSDAYINSIRPMQILMPTLLLIGITNILGTQILVPLGKEKTVLKSVVAGAIIDLLLNAILIPKYASTGAAIGTLVAEIVVLIVQFVALRHEMMDAFKQINYIKIATASLLGLLASLWIKSLGLGSFSTLVISSCLFFGVYGIFLLLTKEKLVEEIFKQVVNILQKKLDIKSA